MVIKIKPSSFELLPTGEFTAVVEGIEYTDGKFGQQLRWRFAIQGNILGEYSQVGHLQPFLLTPNCFRGLRLH